jgi:hypothetical protein
MMCRSFQSAIAALLLGFVFNVCAEPNSEVKFSELYAGALLGDDVVVQVPDDKILVVDDGGSPYQLERRNLFVIAARARIDGNPVLRSFSLDNVAAATDGVPSTPPSKPDDSSATGDKGRAGATGKPGMDAGLIVLDIAEVTLSQGASLSVELRGQTGGKGQKGGQGGRGGSGASGRGAKSDFPSCSRPCPDTGVRGGPGGQRGAGGIGGPGGAGGTVFLSAKVQELYSANPGVFSITVKGGTAGQTGDVGERGIGGKGGPRGPGGNCECKNVPGPGPDGQIGADIADQTPPGTAGSDGKIQEL